MQGRQCINDAPMRENGGFGYEGRIFWNRFSWGSGSGCDRL